MKFKICLILFLIAVVAPTDIVKGVVKNHGDLAAVLRSELLDVQTREAELRIRLQMLDEDIKPENIERALAGIGSTKPEELREQRRRLLSIERDGVLARLKLLEKNRERLEAAIASAELEAYQQTVRQLENESTPQQ